MARRTVESIDFGASGIYLAGLTKPLMATKARFRSATLPLRLVQLAARAKRSEISWVAHAMEMGSKHSDLMLHPRS